jgi:hypothetical protein
MVCFFAESDAVVYAAIPPASETEPSRVVPSQNVTSSPSGLVPSSRVTVAVNVSGWPSRDGEPDEARRVVDRIWRVHVDDFVPYCAQH